MKKNKKFEKVTPVVETKETNHLTVGDVINTLVKFPPHAKIHVGGVTVSGDELDYELLENVTKDPKVKTVETNIVNNEYLDECCPIKELPEDEEEKSYEDQVMEDHLYGYEDLIQPTRRVSSDRLTDSPLMIPNKQELDFEDKNLYSPQTMCIDEIRRHNVFVAECMAEMYRRQISALLEYNTQCLAHFGCDTNKVMCRIINPTHDVEVTEF